METFTLKDRVKSSFDSDLLQLLDLPEQDYVDGSSAAWLGIENEYGQLYRLVGLESVIAVSRVTKDLRGVGYWFEPSDPLPNWPFHGFVSKKVDQGEDSGEDSVNEPSVLLRLV